MNKVSKNPFVILAGEGYATIIARCMSKKSEKTWIHQMKYQRSLLSWFVR